MLYDIIIIGSGISGLYSAFHLSKKYNILILEKNSKFGGRIKTIHNKKLIYDVGAGRISSKHKLLLDLIKDLNLQHKLVEIGNHSNIQNKKMIRVINKYSKSEINNNFADSLLSSLEPCELQKNHAYYNNLRNQSGTGFLLYLKNNYGKTFYTLQDGLDQITKKLSKNQNIKYNQIFENYSYRNKVFNIKTNKSEFKSKILILTIPKEELIKIGPLKNLTILNSVSHNNPYIRIFFKFPKMNNKIWFKDKNVSIHYHSLIRYFIPMDIKNGLIQLYCDGRAANKCKELLIKGILKKELMKGLRNIFPNDKIPNPTFMKPYFWNNGAHFWLPNVNIQKVYKKVMKPYSNKPLYICGESYSKYQAWMEGALETSSKVIQNIISRQPHTIHNYNTNSKKNESKRIFSKKKNKINKNVKIFTVKEVKKHNKKNDAWIIIDNNVYDITNWIDKHPGGPEVFKFGTNNSSKFHSISIHKNNNRVSKELKKYFIGKIK